MPARDVNDTPDPSDDLKRERFVAMISDHFGDRAVDLVKAQIDAADGEALAAWRSVLGRMQEIGISGDYKATIRPLDRRAGGNPSGSRE